jgi:protein-tyrosine phosphatase
MSTPISLSQFRVPFATTYWVVPQQFLAGEHPVEISEDLTIARLMALLDAGVRTFVNLTEEREKMQSYSHLARTLATEKRMKVEILRIPIPDRNVPPVETLRSILDVIDDSIAKGNPVFVHCFAGIGRTGTIVGCYLRRHGAATEQNVIAKIVELRSLMPGGREASPHTPEQVQLVKNWKTGS